MTCIVGIAQDGAVWMGGDSLCNGDGIVSTFAEGKVFRTGEFVMGCCGDSRLGNILRYGFRAPRITGNLDAFMATHFTLALRECFKTHGYLKTENGRDEVGGNILIGVRGKLYDVDGYFNCIRRKEVFYAIGSGRELALGALHVTAGREPEKRLLLALEAAAAWEQGVRAPFTILSVGLESKANKLMMKAWESLHADKKAQKRAGRSGNKRDAAKLSGLAEGR